ncbi:uncharacterized protein TrAtP1_001580 [Trichoderma atroviride]|uniref:uncharacterized protein n=1 Tax=Hypocrea atroviridis TaxID=63577 RepID=UPI00331E49D5|nr:hypothetical protein TrAtP1_001580 [Trichoderma atroviride]
MQSDKGMQMGSISCAPRESPDPDSVCDATLYVTALFGLQRQSPTFPTSTSRVGSNRGVPTMAAFLFHDPTPMSFSHLGWLARFLTDIDSSRIGGRKGLRDTSTRHSRGTRWKNKAKEEESFGALLKNRAKHLIRWSLTSSHHIGIYLYIHSSSSRQAR